MSVRRPVGGRRPVTDASRAGAGAIAATGRIGVLLQPAGAPA
jgi:hypothetical protein